jgi:NADPH-dependent curcumin reductase CurA
MRGWGIGTAVASENPRYPVGQTVQGLVGWQEYAVVSDATLLQTFEIADGVAPSLYLGALGKTGLTAWVGMHEVGNVDPDLICSN